MALDKDGFLSNSTDEYEDITLVDKLPRKTSREDCSVTHGYAVGANGTGGRLAQTWFFFHHLEPALAFGRAARVSTAVSGYGVYAAARKVKFSDAKGADEVFLYLIGETLDRRPDENAYLTRWVRGVKPGRAGWRPDE
ncbi:MAG: hypothetical protein ACJ768_24545 [Gaiellaceae bacterium]